MQEWLVSLVGEDLAPMASWALAAVIVIVLIFVVIWVAKKALGGTSGARVKGRGPRLAVMDVTPIDQKRKLVLVRRDEVEHLLLIGGQNDVVVEASILRVPTSGRMQRTEPAMRPDAELSGRDRMAAGPVAPAPPSLPEAQRQGAPLAKPQQAQRPAAGAMARATSPLARSVPRPAAPLPVEEPSAPSITPFSVAEEVAPVERQAPTRQMPPAITAVIRDEADQMPEPKGRRGSQDLPPPSLSGQRRDPDFTDAPTAPETEVQGVDTQRRPERSSQQDVRVRVEPALEPRSPIGGAADEPRNETSIARPTSGGGVPASVSPSPVPSVAPPVFATAPFVPPAFMPPASTSPVFMAPTISAAAVRPPSQVSDIPAPRYAEVRVDDFLAAPETTDAPAARVEDDLRRNAGDENRRTSSPPQSPPARSQADRPISVDGAPVRRAPQTAFQRTAIAGSDAFRRVSGSAESEGAQTAASGAAVGAQKSTIPSAPAPAASVFPASRTTTGLLPTSVVSPARSMATPTIPLRVPVTEERPARGKSAPAVAALEPDASNPTNGDGDDTSNGGFMPVAQEPSSLPEAVTEPLAPTESPVLARPPVASAPVMAPLPPTPRMPLASQSPLIAAAERQRDAIRNRINPTAPSVAAPPPLQTSVSSASVLPSPTPIAPSTPVTSNWNPVPVAPTAVISPTETASPVTDTIAADDPKTSDASPETRREDEAEKRPLSVRSFATAIQTMKPTYEPPQRVAPAIEPQESATAVETIIAAPPTPVPPAAVAAAVPIVASGLATPESVPVVEASERQGTTESTQTTSLEDFLSAELDSDFGNVRWDDDEAGRTTPSVEPPAGTKTAEAPEGPSAADAGIEDAPVEEAPKQPLTLEEEMERLLGDFDFVTSDRKSN